MKINIINEVDLDEVKKHYLIDELIEICESYDNNYFIEQIKIILDEYNP